MPLTSDSRPGPRQYSLRALWVVVTLVCVASAVVGLAMRDESVRRLALVAVMFFNAVGPGLWVMRFRYRAAWREFEQTGKDLFEEPNFLLPIRIPFMGVVLLFWMYCDGMLATFLFLLYTDSFPRSATHFELIAFHFVVTFLSASCGWIAAHIGRLCTMARPSPFREYGVMTDVGEFVRWEDVLGYRWRGGHLRAMYELEIDRAEGLAWVNVARPQRRNVERILAERGIVELPYK